MDIQKVFKAVKAEPDQPTLIVVVSEFERQGYRVIVGDKYYGLQALKKTEEDGELQLLSLNNGILVHIEKEGEKQSFRLHLLDIDAICITDVDSPPVIYNPEYTTGFYKFGENN